MLRGQAGITGSSVRTQRLAHASSIFGDPTHCSPTSGLADPQSVRAAIASDHRLSRRIEVSEVVVIIDAINGLELLRDEALARRQIPCADCLIVAKTDAVESQDVARLLRRFA